MLQFKERMPSWAISLYRLISGNGSPRSIKASNLSPNVYRDMHEATSNFAKKKPENTPMPTEEKKEETSESPLILLPDDLSGIYKYFGTDPRDSDKWAFPDAINALIKLGEIMREKGLEIGVGDISLEKGGPFFEYGSLKKLSHQTHREGKDIDIRPIRKDRKRLPVTWKSSAYDMESTHELVKLAKEVGFKWLYFNDPIIDASYEWVLSCRGHNNHLHLHY